MNLYEYYVEPSELDSYAERHVCVSDLAYECACKLRSRFEAGEAVIASNAPWAYRYAKNIIDGRFELGEKTIAGSAYWSYLYARDVLRGRFEAGEEAINRDIFYSSSYERIFEFEL